MSKENLDDEPEEPVKEHIKKYTKEDEEIRKKRRREMYEDEESGMYY